MDAISKKPALSKEHRLKLSRAAKMRWAKEKPVVKCVTDGRVFDSIQDAKQFYSTESTPILLILRD